MKIVIIEDEEFAARRLENMIQVYNPAFTIAAKLESVHDSVDWFGQNPQPDLIFLDIHLEDDLSLAIFKKVTVTCPIIFTTATDELAIRAFQTKCIDYLHKPVVQTELIRLLDKYSTGEKRECKPVDASFFNDLIGNKP
jgi:DNA-binding LytR/AlgR family response regulator